MAWSFIAVAMLLPFPLQKADVQTILSMDKASRIHAIAAAPQEYVPPLIQALKDRKANTRRGAVIALQYFDPARPDGYREEEVPAIDDLRPSVVAALATASHDPDRQVRESAMESLVLLLRVRNWGRHGEAWYSTRTIAPLTNLGRSIVPTLIKVLTAEDDHRYSAKVTALAVLRLLKDRRALPVLLRTIDHSYGACLNEAMEAAIEVPDPRVATTIVRNIAKTIPDHSASPGIWALRRMKKGDAAPALIDGLTHNKDAGVRFYCAVALAAIVDKHAIPPLILALRDPDEGLRSQAASALGSYPDPRVVNALCQAATDPSSRVRSAVVCSLVDLREGKAIVLQALKDPDSDVRISAVGIARMDSELGIQVLSPLVEDPTLEFTILRELRPFHDRRTIPMFVRALKQTSEYGQYASEAGMALGEMKVSEAIPILIDHLSDDSTSYGAVEALALFGREPAQGLLAKFPKSDKDRYFFVEALGNAGDPRAKDLLLPLIENPKLVGQVAVALGKLHDLRAVLPLIVQLDIQKGYDAAYIADGLAYLGSHLAVRCLTLKMVDTDARPSVGAALARIGDPASLDTLLAFLATDEEGRWMALDWMANFKDPRVLNLLIKVLGEDGTESAAAARALGRYGDLRALGPLHHAAASEDKETAHDATEAIWLLKGHG